MIGVNTMGVVRATRAEVAWRKPPMRQPVDQSARIECMLTTAAPRQDGR